MSNLLRADTDQMRATVQKLQQGSQALQESYERARQAMSAMQNSPWSGQNRVMAENYWQTLEARFAPSFETIEDIAQRLLRTAEAYDEAARVFGERGIAGAEAYHNAASLDLSNPPSAPLPPPKPSTGDGSKPFGSENANPLDYLTEQTFYKVADGAEVIGMTDAAYHMRHYLDGSGEPIHVDPEQLLRDLPQFQAEVKNARYTFFEEIRKDLLQGYNGESLQKEFTSNFSGSSWRNFYASQAQSQNWFYGLGGFSYSFTGVAEIVPPIHPGETPTIYIKDQLHVFDRYNWDEGKKVEIVGIEVTDKTLGRLHEVGLAQEYEVHGSSSVNVTTFPADTSPSSSQIRDIPITDNRSGTRSDPSRERY